jgi:hypothetical protein
MLKAGEDEAVTQRTRLGQGWCMPKTVRRFGSRLLAQELWCVGRDIEHPNDNLLMRYGFERYRDRETSDRSTCYRLDRDELHVALWGFGMFFGKRELGGLFLGRVEFCPDWAPIESVSLAIHWPDDLPKFTRPHGLDQWRRARELWTSMLLWVSEYEQWIIETAGLEYRQQCVASWLRPFVHADQMAPAWQFLGSRGWEEEEQSPQQALRRFTICTDTS